jgi:hypothetical protein
MKLSYWVANRLDDSRVYSIRTKTKKEALAALEESGIPRSFGPVHRVTVEYYDAFDLMQSCMCEMHGYWES